MLCRLLLLVVIASAAGTTLAGWLHSMETGQAAGPQKVVVAVWARLPDYNLRKVGRGLQVFRQSGAVVSLPGYDFEDALAQRLVAALGKDKRMEFRVAAAADPIQVRPLWEGKQRPSSTLGADRLLLVSVAEFGAYTEPIGKDRSYLHEAEARLIDRVSGNVLWQFQKRWVFLGLGGKISELENNPDALKAALNGLLEHFSREVHQALRKAKL